MSVKRKSETSNRWRHRIHEIIFEADTFEGKLFDIILLLMILCSIIAVSWESLPNLDLRTKHRLYIIEWILTIFFTIEYILRLYSVNKPLQYAKSFFGVVDLLAIIPTYLSIFIVGTHSLVILRALRLLRLFRIFKMVHYLNQGNIILKSLRASLPKLTVFAYFVVVMVCIFGAVMYLIEGSSNKEFDSIPRSIYWAIVTITTVGYGDIAPHTAFGQFLSAILMIMGYAVIAVPTGIVSSDIINESHKKTEEEISTQSCMHCCKEGHDSDALYCKFCGELINGPITTE